MSPLNIVVGITGGIAAYKAVGVVRALVLAGHDVHVVPTEGALRFVGRPTLEAISRNPVHTDLYEGVAEVRHVAIGQAADLIVIAPATANTIAKLATGLADDLLGNTVLASEAPVVIAPAMHTEMWRHPATQANVATLRSRGVTIVGPAVGQLTGADSGPGRMEEPEVIAAAALERAAASARRDLAGRRVVVTAGGTREPLDPVRFLGNRSSGKQGVAIAEAARARGAEVTLIAANLEIADPEGCDIRRVSTALELQEAVTDAAKGADVVVMAAAVADYRPAVAADAKLKKDEREELVVALERTPDILSGLAAIRRADQTVVGFAAEHGDGAVAYGREKLARKGLDAVVVNDIARADIGFEGAHNEVTIVTADGERPVPRASKAEIARAILEAVAALRSGERTTA
jgi:phosphopantothenoylcysteine decarboxylase / phosphopantothenate---cysteine ligase